MIMTGTHDNLLDICFFTNLQVRQFTYGKPFGTYKVGSRSRKVRVCEAKTFFKVVLDGYRRCPDSHDLSEC